MKKIRSVISSILGVLIFIWAIPVFPTSQIAGILLLIVSAFCFPQIREFFYKKTGKNLTMKEKFITCVILIIISGYFLTKADELDKKESLVAFQKETILKQKQEEKELKEDFNKNKEKIITDLKRLIDNKKYEEASILASKYSKFENEELIELSQIIRKELLLGSLKNLKNKDDIFFLADTYSELLQIEPDNSEYQKQFNLYNSKVALIKEKQLVEENKRYQQEQKKRSIENQFSAWDGSHKVLERVIKQGMNDPDSYEHVETKYIDNGNYLIVTTKFRGNNAFGGKVLNSITAKIDYNGNIIERIQ